MIYLIIGVPGTGKSWVCNKLQALANLNATIVQHDHYMKKQYIPALVKAASLDTNVIGELPFGISEQMAELKAKGCDVCPIFIIEDEKTLRQRYQLREGREIVQGHLTRQNTYKQRAVEYKAFSGTSQQVFDYLLKKIKENQK